MMFYNQHHITITSSNNSNLEKVMVNDAVVWEQTDVSATQTTARLAGGAMTATANYTSEGLLSGLNTSMGSGIAGTLRNYTYSFNSATGNLESRSFNNRLTPTAVTETFAYDNLYRLTAADTMLMTYQPNGNVDTKTGLGQYTYGGNGAGPHAVTSVANSAWRSGQEIEYNVFNRATTIIDTLGGRRYRLDITCGPGRERVKTELRENGMLKKAVIFNGNYERTVKGDTITHLYYIGGGDGLCGIYVKQTKGAAILKDGMYYVHTDHLGSLAVITDATGNIVQQATFDVWGVRTFTVKDPTLVFDRGFTGHEHLDEFGLINMNARLYDPVLGRFLSPDPFVKAPDFSQSYNRYSYALNNPLIFTDPDGEFLIPLLIGAAIGVVTNGINNVVHDHEFFRGAGKAALIGGIGGVFSFGIGQIASGLTGFEKVFTQTFLHSFSGGVMSAAGGGDFGAGLLSGAIGSLSATGAGALLKNVNSNFAKSLGVIGSGAISGGISSEIAGGNFWNGFRNGVISSTLNHGIHSGLFGEGLAMASITGKTRHLWGPDAISVAVTGDISAGVSASIEEGVLHILRGKDQGAYSLHDMGIGIGGLSASAGVELMKYYDSAAEVSLNHFYGNRYEVNLSLTAFDVSVGLTGMFSKYDGGFVIGYGSTVALDAIPFNIGFNFNKGVSKQYFYQLNAVQDIFKTLW